MIKNLAPIVLFVYNRPWHIQQTLDALQKNQLASESELFIYSDAAKNNAEKASVVEVRELIKKVTGFKKVTVIERDKNWGLAASIIDGVTTIVNQYGTIIVLEDDLVTSPYFLKYLNDGLNSYKDIESVASIHGYIYPINGLPSSFFIKGADCWGWGTWKRAWDIFDPDGQKLLNELQSRKLEKEVNFNGSYLYSEMLKDQINGKNDSWAVRWYMSAFLQNMLTLYPGQSYVQNIGNDDSGTHCGTSDLYSGELNYTDVYPVKIIEDAESRKKIEDFFNSIKRSYFKILMAKIKCYLR